MFKFNKTYDIILEDIIQSVTPEELKERQREYTKIEIKQYFDKFIKENTMVKNEDGSYDVNRNINLYHINLTSLLDIPYKLNKVNGWFDCSDNNLTDLEGCPTIINGIFDCSTNNLTSLEGCSKILNKSFVCSFNCLTNLIGCPEIINGNFNCSDNDLTSLEGCPKEVKGDFWIRRIRNGGKFVEFTEEDIREVCKVEAYVHV